MISEGWDYPELKVLVMARPTLSKVLYLQQIGRGLRKTREKNNVFIIDVVDEYGAMARPCSMHSLFHNPYYVPFGDITRQYTPGEMIEVDGLVERVERIVEVDVETFEEKYGNYLNEEQLARELFKNTGTIRKWIKDQSIIPDVVIPFGTRKINLFSPENVENIKIIKEIPEHNDETIKKDFFDFLEERTYTFSYKMIFLLGFMKYMDSIGDVDIDDLLQYYIHFYKNRLETNQAIDRQNCPLDMNKLNDTKYMKNNMLTNPFEKFERKRFMYYSKELGKISFNHNLLSKLEKKDLERIINQMNEDLENYYKNL
ncbi:MAG: hypothetical protein Q4C49_07730 [Bacillota bacterium]|nr:hypothetical protein [Bacillota bacterium]